MDPGIHDYASTRTSANAIGAQAIGALAVGAVAIGALAAVVSRSVA